MSIPVQSETYRLDKRAIENDSMRTTAHKILSRVMAFRRVPNRFENYQIDCVRCLSPHLPKVVSSVKENKPVTFVLPAFPGKSPNRDKVLGTLPDKAERLSFHFLNTLCEDIKKIYPPGAHIILCSDGRVFSDLVGIKEKNITSYQNELNRLIKTYGFSNLSLFNLDNVYGELSFQEMRTMLMNAFGQSKASLKHRIQLGSRPHAAAHEEEAKRMYCGITRFLFEDAMYVGQTKSRTAIQKESRFKALEVIRRSNAWSELIADYFPRAVRLSIHPQTCGARKLGIRLIGNESWITPWHGVAVESKSGFVLLKRVEAEALGAKLVYCREGRRSHYKLTSGV